MEINPFDAKIVQMLSRLDEADMYGPIYGPGDNDDRLEGPKAGDNYFRDLTAKKLIRAGHFMVSKDFEKIVMKNASGKKITIDQRGRIDGMPYKEYIAKLNSGTLEEADVPMPTAPSVGDMPEGPENLMTGEMPGPDAAAPPEDAELADEEDDDEKETPEGIREYIDMIRRAITMDPNSLELSDFQKKALYTGITAKNAMDRLKVFNKILDDYDPIETPEEVPAFDPYATGNS